MPSDFAFKAMNTFHRGLLRLSGGRVGWKASDMPVRLLNLRDNPEVAVTLQGKPAQPMRARVATPEERSRLWPCVVADHKNYAGYQTRTTREIPLVLLERTV
jgi:deazaflavin-dependent oxidoreductase (nitroreductase family)